MLRNVIVGDVCGRLQNKYPTIVDQNVLCIPTMCQYVVVHACRELDDVDFNFDETEQNTD